VAKPRPELSERPSLGLPDVAELVRKQIRRRVLVTNDDRPPERVAAVTTEPGNPEESRLDEDADSRERNGDVVELEPVEARLRVFEPLTLLREPVRHGKSLTPALTAELGEEVPD
jgi:hypothetical protein